VLFSKADISFRLNSILSPQTCLYLIALAFWRFITELFYAKYQDGKTQFNATSVALFHGLDTLTEKCYCSQNLRTEWVKITCAAEQEGSCTVLKVRKSQNSNSLFGIRDLFRALRTCTHSAISANWVVHSFRHIVIADWWGIKLTAWRCLSNVWDLIACKSVSGVEWRVDSGQ
jgi:hypothetical protein